MSSLKPENHNLARSDTTALVQYEGLACIFNLLGSPAPEHRVCALAKNGLMFYD